MYKLKFDDRFTYKKTSHFWNVLNNLEENLPNNSIGYATVSRDKALFHLCYSFGLRPLEALNLSILDLNFDHLEEKNKLFGSVYVNYQRLEDSRMVYPLYNESIEHIKGFIDIYDIFFRNNSSRKLFVTTKGNVLTLHYLKKRLRYYNSKLPLDKQIDSIYYFRQFYIADLLRIRDLSQTFINNQIGNNIINNQLYSRL
ncbi:site-specific integrase [Wukongibacter sp. M2B1]|uniref:site-specific integrase n=1 Tax=Wukongibacter sp. M2B1 TaxID=3088895 RepID=UPI003D7924EE